MTPEPEDLQAEWFSSGGAALGRMLAEVDQSTRSVRLEMYIIRPGSPGDDMLLALLHAALRGVRVRVLYDSLGSAGLPAGFWSALRRAGAEVREFNPVASRRIVVRDHRKLLVCDDRTAFVVGFNLSPEYDGDGIESGWRDTGVAVRGAVVPALALEFDHQFDQAAARPRVGIRIRSRREGASDDFGPRLRVLPVRPGRGPSCLLREMARDLATAREVTVVTPYFLPPSTLRNALRRVVRRGGRVRLILPAISDVRLAQLAARRLYTGLLRAGIEVWEYLPRVLHAKLVVIDGVVYTGSSNLDPRSLYLNHELMLRLADPGIRRRVGEDLDDLLRRSRRLELRAWRRSRTFLDRLRERAAFLVLYRLDPWVARRIHPHPPG